MGVIIMFALITIVVFVVFGFLWLIGAAMAVGNIHQGPTPRKKEYDPANESKASPQIWG